MRRVFSPQPDRVWQGLLVAALAGFAAAAVAQLGFGADVSGWLVWLPDCRIRLLTGFDCPGCGMTRAWLLLAGWQLEASFRTHPLAGPLLVAAAVALWRSSESGAPEGEQEQATREGGGGDRSPLGRETAAPNPFDRVGREEHQKG